MSYKSIRSLIYTKKKYMFMSSVEFLPCSRPCSRLTAFNLTFWLINDSSSWASSALFVLQIEVNSRVTQKKWRKKTLFPKLVVRNTVELNNDGARHSKY